MADQQPPPLMGATAIRPPDRVGAEKYTYILYDPKNGTILTRTPKSWALIILFYCIYYSCLAAFWLACMKIFLTIQIQDPSDMANAKPTWTMDKSIIGIRPGIGVRPIQTYEEVDSGIFELNLEEVKDEMEKDYDKFKIDTGIKNEDEDKDDDPDNKYIMENYLINVKGSKGYAYRAKHFFQVYENNKNSNKPRGKDCRAQENGYRPDGVDFCQFDTRHLGPCEKFPYGYSKDAFNPCVFVKMNRIMDLRPAPMTNNSQDASITDDPKTAEIMNFLIGKNPKDLYINCEGQYPADKETVKVNVFPQAFGEYPGLGKIPLKYFPYSKFMKDDEGRSANESPMIAVQFEKLEQAKGRLVHVICKAYFHGVVHSKKDKAGLVQFEVLLNA